MDTTGASVAKYAYDAWGRVVYSTGSMATVNPIRYRGYYYDAELGMYYLGGRYYDPQVKRFINADHANLIAANTYGLTDKNLFSYCDNNPVIRGDEDGELWNVVVGAVVGGVLGSVGEIVSQVATGTSLKDIDWTDVAIEGVSGAMTGGLLSMGVATPIVTTGRALINAATSVSHSINHKESASKVVSKACLSATGTIIAGKVFNTNGIGKVPGNRAIRAGTRTATRVLTSNKKRVLTKTNLRKRKSVSRITYLRSATSRRSLYA